MIDADIINFCCTYLIIGLIVRQLMMAPITALLIEIMNHTKKEYREAASEGYRTGTKVAGRTPLLSIFIVTLLFPLIPVFYLVSRKLVDTLNCEEEERNRAA